jgi:hypothetical protein
LGEVGAGLITAGIAGLIEGDLKKGLTAGMEAYGGAKIASGISQLGKQEAIRQARLGEALTKTAEVGRKEFGLEPVDLSRAASATTMADLGIVPTKTPFVSQSQLQAPGTFGLRPASDRLERINLGDLAKDISEEAARSQATPKRGTFGEFGLGIKSLFTGQGGRDFISSLGGPQQAGFVVSPILGALQRAERESAQRKFARSQTPNYYYVPGAFDFESGTFAPGGYYTAPGQPYTPKTGFAGGGIVFQEGGETGTEGLKQYYQGLLAPPDTGMGEARRAETLAYISALNQQLGKPMPGDTGQAPPGSGGTDIVGTPGGGSSIGYGGYPVGPGMPGSLPPPDMGGPIMGFDPNAGISYPGQSLSDFLRESRTSVEKPAEEKPAEEKPEEESKQESSPLREGVGAVGSAITSVTDPLLNLYDNLGIFRNLAPFYTPIKALDKIAEEAKKFGIRVPAAPDLEASPVEMQQPAPMEVQPPDPFLMDLLRNLEKSPEGPEGRIIIEDLSMPGDITQGGTFDPGSILTPDIGAPSGLDTPYNPLEQDPFGGRGIGLGQQSGAMGPGYNFGFAKGGIIPANQYAAGGKLLNGPGDGMSDDIKANIDGQQEARLADGEFVVPADVVSHLGNGSTKAGAQKLYAMMDRVRKARTGSTKQGREINPNKFIPA